MGREQQGGPKLQGANYTHRIGGIVGKCAQHQPVLGDALHPGANIGNQGTKKPDAVSGIFQGCESFSHVKASLLKVLNFTPTPVPAAPPLAPAAPPLVPAAPPPPQVKLRRRRPPLPAHHQPPGSWRQQANPRAPSALKTRLKRQQKKGGAAKSRTPLMGL